MSGMDRTTGKPLADEQHIAQSITDIVTTPLGTRVERRDYGGPLPELVDAPQNKATQLLLFASITGPVRKWEPRVRLTKVALGALTAAGRPTLTIDGRRTDLPGNPPFSMSLAL
ncbi:hypothetical protein MB02_01215 [Croceicoccus estronivorus]|uniref:GPW/gp25 family protein n=1 Tax=Croceicoccus estronivorus TaxID=1172626 RepID=UPI000835013B|nr:GPW/gp25 family protein [Croceicoccus estronivorus]OCC25322.1 hypothetical protein MB02_01215 [Croceicoccus estronivorus]